MSKVFRFLCPGEARRLLILLGLIFALLLVVQYSELPYGTVLSSLISSVGKFSGIQSSLNSESEGNNSYFKVPSSNDAFHKKASGPVTSNGEIPIAAPAPQEYRGTLEQKTVSTKEDNFSVSGALTENIAPIISLGRGNGNSHIRLAPSLQALPPMVPLPQRSPSGDKETVGWKLMAHKDGKPVSLDGNSTATSNPNAKSKPSIPKVNKGSKAPPSVVVPISEMNRLLQLSHAPSRQVAPKWFTLVDRELLHAKSQIENAKIIENDEMLYSCLYRNVAMFKRSYEQMEKMLKVYIYKEGEKPIFHQPLLDGIYASEGWFMKLMEASKQFVTEDPQKAHLFYLPFSSRLLELTLYKRNSHKRSNLIQYMKNYVDMILRRHPHWNRTSGADHFLAACHDWAPAETRERMLNCIRALCNADIDVGFKIGKDVSLPETYVPSAENPVKDLGGNPPSQRHILAFFAGNLHGYLRPILLKYWENKDPDMKISGPMPHVRGNMNYLQHMKSSKYCICARGHEVNSPRIVESIFHECIPVIISDNYVPPFFEILDWESFAVFVMEKDVPNLKNLLLSISEEKYLEMHKRVKKVQQHFLWHAEPVKYDLFHMILHSVWYNRVLQLRPK